MWRSHNCHKLNLATVSSYWRRTNLIERNWLTELKLGWNELYQMYQQKALMTILNSRKAVFKEEMGKPVRVTTTAHVSDSAKPFCRPRLIPHALRGKVEL